MKIKENLENGISARALEFNEEEQELVKDMFLLTTKPILYIANISEEQITTWQNDENVKKVQEYAKKENSDIVPLCVKIEEEISYVEIEEIRNTEIQNVIYMFKKVLIAR